MRKYIQFTLVLLLTLTPMLTSCEVHTSDNGKLDGFWQVKGMEMQGDCFGKDIKPLPMYWSFQGKLMEIRHKEEPWGVFFRFEHKGDTLTLSEPVRNNRDSSDIKITDPVLLHQYGIYHLKEQLQVLRLTDEWMVLQSDSVIFTFRKY